MRQQVLMQGEASEVSIAFDNNNLVIFSKEYVLEDVNVIDTLEYNTVQIFSIDQSNVGPPVTERRKLNIEFPRGLYFIDVIAVSSYIFIGEKNTSQCYLFDQKTWKWCTLAPVKYNGSLLKNFSLTACKNNVFSLGGMIENEFSKVILKFSFYFNYWLHVADFCDSIVNMAHVADEAQNIIYLVGGYEADYKESKVCSKRFYKLNAKTSQLKSLEYFPGDVPGIHVFLSYFSFNSKENNKLLIAVPIERNFDCIYVYKITENEWASVSSLNLVKGLYPQYYHCCIKTGRGNQYYMYTNNPKQYIVNNNKQKRSFELTWYSSWELHDNFYLITGSTRRENIVALPSNWYQRKFIYTDIKRFPDD